jgi:DNA-binding XRE family transcriptional regulator
MQWERGQKSRLAERVGVSRQNLCEIIKGRRGATTDLAILIERESAKMGIPISRLDVLYPKESTNPLIEATSSSND